ncbi:hypothetical protein [Teichococcus cervicalis]|uniref:Uncharacterized protein n=2 Tax=Teichococcus cervicalis TaxID=204525 RepID=D5RP25_9PROT|nr:hypothetical protein [Pseudoroseomonas cervicalis]EFH10944.1 hypothetical protein HMPREF0731_2836 [Pseudoroseomonas cervicalis ATCC 49957]
MSGDFDTSIFAPPGGYSVRIRDLSGGNGAEPVETIRGFQTLAQANAFARRYVRDSVERCRAAGLTPDEVLAAWFAFGEDAEVTGGPGGQGWSSGAEIQDFASKPVKDREERNWRVLDPRRQDEDEAEDEA